MSYGVVLSDEARKTLLRADARLDYGFRSGSMSLPQIPLTPASRRR